MGKLYIFRQQDSWNILVARYDEHENIVTFYFHPGQRRLWKRIVIALKYIFRPSIMPGNSQECYIIFNLQSSDKEKFINLIRMLK